jgi:hypothetical protein
MIFKQSAATQLAVIDRAAVHDLPYLKLAVTTD